MIQGEGSRLRRRTDVGDAKETIELAISVERGSADFTEPTAEPVSQRCGKMAIESVREGNLQHGSGG